MTTRSTDTVCGLASSTGHHRNRNEDAALPGPHWYVVADGMGGHDDGDVASRLVIDAFSDASPASAERVRGTIAELVSRANESVRHHARRAGSTAVGSTVVGLAVADSRPPVVFHVGDSRCYRLVDGELRLLTRDHSHVQELIDANLLTTEQAARHPLRNVVTRSIGIDPTVTADLVELDGRPSRYLLCSDGLTDEIGPRVIGRVLMAIDDPQAAADRLVELALAGPATDNITALVVDVDPMRENGSRRHHDPLELRP